jgi:hypothetical protein
LIFIFFLLYRARGLDRGGVFSSVFVFLRVE